jgi:hypothetical protein
MLLVCCCAISAGVVPTGIAARALQRLCQQLTIRFGSALTALLVTVWATLLLHARLRWRTIESKWLLV